MGKARDQSAHVLAGVVEKTLEAVARYQGGDPTTEDHGPIADGHMPELLKPPATLISSTPPGAHLVPGSVVVHALNQTLYPRGLPPRPERCLKRPWGSARRSRARNTARSYNNLAAYLNAHGKYA